MVENLVGYAKRDLVIPLDPGASLAEANAAAATWCAEVNANVHRETMAVPSERLELERRALRPLPSLRPPLRSGALRTVDRLSTIRFGSARYSVPAALVGKKVEVSALDGEIVIAYADAEVARHLAVAPGEASIEDAHYGGARVRPLRAVRPKSAAERAFLALGPAAERFLRAAAARRTLEVRPTQRVAPSRTRQTSPRRALSPRLRSYKVRPAAFIVQSDVEDDPSDPDWIVGVVVENPYYHARRRPLTLPEEAPTVLSETSLLVCDFALTTLFAGRAVGTS